MENFAANRFLNVRGGFRKRACCTRADRDTGAFAGKLLRDRASQSLAGSRDNGHASREPQIHSGTSIKTSIVSRIRSTVKCPAVVPYSLELVYKHFQHCQTDAVLISGSTFFEVFIGLTKLQAKIYSAPR